MGCCVISSSFLLIIIVVVMLVLVEPIFPQPIPDDQHSGSFWKDADDFRSAYCCKCPNYLQFPFWKMEKSLRIRVEECEVLDNHVGAEIGEEVDHPLHDYDHATEAADFPETNLICIFALSMLLITRCYETFRVWIRIKKISRSKNAESNGEMNKEHALNNTNKQHKLFPETTCQITISDKSEDEPAASNEECTTPSPCDNWCYNPPEDNSSKTTENEVLENPEDAEMGEEVDHHSCEWTLEGFLPHEMGYTVTIACRDAETALCICEGDSSILKDKQLLQKYGVLESEGRYKMLLLCAKKAKQQENRSYGGDLKRALEKFLHTKIKTGGMRYKEFCRLVVQLVPEDKWTRFVRLHLNLDEEEIQAFRRKYCTFNSEQKLQIQQGMLHVDGITTDARKTENQNF